MLRSFLSATLLVVLAACNQASSQAPASPGPGPSATSSATPAAASGVVVSTNAEGEPAFTIDSADATCTSNTDCRLTMTQCSCDCGSPVNVTKAQKYADARERMCKGYAGRECKMSCTDTVTCDSGVCRIKK
jgi:hypothetical protein